VKLFPAAQIKELDQYTIMHEPVSPVDLMERAGEKFAVYLLDHFSFLSSFVIFCGPGNNGGDGLVVARLLAWANKKVDVVILKGDYTQEFIHNFSRLRELNIPHHVIEIEQEVETLHLSGSSCFIDALFGAGLSRSLNGVASALVRKINASEIYTVALDLPSGLSPDAVFKSNSGNTVIADLTLTIQFPKLSFFFAENAVFTGDFECMDIGLSRRYIDIAPGDLYYTGEEEIRDIIRPRPSGGHKGNFGHTLIISGSEGKEGSSILCAEAALRSGCGLLTAMVPKNVAKPLLGRLPEAMIIRGNGIDKLKALDLGRFAAIGFGPGVGLDKEKKRMMAYLLKNFKGPIVIDADGITLLASDPAFYGLLNSRVVLTPHPGEFDRMTKVHKSGKERYLAQLEFAGKYKVNVLLKGRYTSVVNPAGKTWFNSTGNSGMATAGSGDVLTGIITSLCAQGYEPFDAAILGAYLHGFAGDKAADSNSRTSLIASDIINHVPDFFLEFEM
jgi:hydroxyethylthiazole kinase-like uncharacterized protein yjeF